MSENVIFCYSGTGNCLDMAKNIARGLGDTDIIMMRRAPEKTDVTDAGRVGFIFPCYAGGLPGEVESFVRMVKLSPEAYTFGIGQFSGYPGNGLHTIDGIVKLDYWTVMSHQCGFMPLFPHQMMMPPMPPAMAQRRSEKTAARIAADISSGKKSKKRPPLYRLNALEYKAWPMLVSMNAKKFLVDPAKCIGCGQCVRICPKGNIHMVCGTPAIGADCYQCLSCLQYCPQKAISLGGVTEKRERYHNPNISPELLNQSIIHID